MSANYNGLTRNIWPGTWSPSSGHPIALDTEIRGSLQSISGELGDRLTNIPGQRLQEGMVVFVKTGYTVGSVSREAEKYYTYRLLAGESRNTSTGAMPNSESNWFEVNLAPVSVTPPQPTIAYESYEFTDSLHWVVQHNKGTLKFMETLTDGEGNRFFAKVHIIDQNSFEVRLASAQSGKVDVMFAFQTMTDK